jgi:hypothetical protein
MLWIATLRCTPKATIRSGRAVAHPDSQSTDSLLAKNQETGFFNSWDMHPWDIDPRAEVPGNKNDTFASDRPGSQTMPECCFNKSNATSEEGT